MSDWCELAENGEFVPIAAPVKSSRRRNRHLTPKNFGPSQRELRIYHPPEPQAIITKEIHGQFVNVTRCKPGRAQGSSANRWSSRYKVYVPYERKPIVGKLKWVELLKIAIDPDDLRSKKAITKRRKRHKRDL